MKKKDGILIGIVLLAALGIWIFSHLGQGDAGTILRVSADGETVGEYALSTDNEISISDTNQCRITDGIVKMTAASCPDQLCMKQKSIDAWGGSIICLPNKVVLEIINQREDEVDSIAR